MDYQASDANGNHFDPSPASMAELDQALAELRSMVVSEPPQEIAVAIYNLAMLSVINNDQHELKDTIWDVSPHIVHKAIGMVLEISNNESDRRDTA